MKNSPQEDFLNGILLIDKPEGITSFDVIRKIKKHFYSIGFTKKTIPKIGHAGTLDPFATGLLIILIGRAVKFSQYFLSSEKKYYGEILFGLHTDSGDNTGHLLKKETEIKLNLELIQKEALSFCASSYYQTPPMHSAKKINGVKLYTLAHQGISIERKAECKRIINFHILNYNNSERSAQFQTEVSSGTYIRVLAQDLAIKLKTHAVLKNLRRTSSGHFLLSSAVSLNQFFENFKTFSDVEKIKKNIFWIPFDEITSENSRIYLSETDCEKIQQGQQSILNGIALPKTNLRTFFIHSKDTKRLVGIVEKNNASLKLLRCFV